MDTKKSKKKEKLSYDDMADKAAMKDMGNESYLRPPPPVKKAPGGMIDGIKGAGKEYMRGAGMLVDDVHRMFGTERGKKLDQAIKKREKERDTEILRKMLGVSENKKGGMIKKKAASKPAAKKMGGGSMKYSKGGSAGRGDGIAQRGKTKGRMC